MIPAFTFRLLRAAVPLTLAVCIHTTPMAFADAVAPAERGTEKPKRLAEGVQDNSFLLEEAYNQEPGVVQHIFTAFSSVNRLHGRDDRQTAFSFTQEWPMGSQTHQFSYTMPWLFSRPADGPRVDGLGDILLNYRYQLTMDTDTRPAITPRLSLILPTGDRNRGLGNGTVGWQTNFAFSKVVSERFTLHANAGATLLPDVRGRTLTGYNLGASAIYALTRRFNLMLETTASWDEQVDDSGARSRSVSVLISPGVRYAFNLRNDAQLVVGVAAPIGLTRGAPDYGVFLYCSFEHFFSRGK